MNTINSNRQKAFGTDDPYKPEPVNKDWENLFILVKDVSGEILGFGRIHSMELKLSNEEVKNVSCFDSVVAVTQGLGHGSLVMEAIKEHVMQNGQTVIGFCETELVPFYKKCGYQVLSFSDNKFAFTDDEGNILPGIVPGEVIYYSGTDRVMEKILASEDKTVRVKRKHYE